MNIVGWVCSIFSMLNILHDFGEWGGYFIVPKETKENKL
jgi:hypothetical protein